MPDPTIIRCSRWLILGAGGSGKSTFAREMAECLGLPVIHLDQHFWKAGWVEIDKGDWANKVTDLSTSDAWIMDGNYGGTIALRLPRAEGAVLARPACLDVSLGYSAPGVVLPRDHAAGSRGRL